MTDMLMCLTAPAQSERAGETGETFRERGRREGKKERKKTGGRGLLVLFNSFPHCHWQQDLRRRFDRCMVMNPHFRWNPPPPFLCTFTICPSLFLSCFLHPSSLFVTHLSTSPSPPPNATGIKEPRPLSEKLVTSTGFRMAKK